MKANYNILQSYIVEQLPAPEELKDIIIFGAFEVEEVVEEGGDIIMDVKVLPDRRADVYDELGLAREICGLLSLHMKDASQYYTPSERTLVFTVDYINKKLGTNIPTGISGSAPFPSERAGDRIVSICSILDRYHYQYTLDGDTITLTIPAERPDIVGVHDILEEIGRPYGYNNIEPQLLPIRPVKHDENYLKINAIKSDLISKGFYEVYNYTFVKKGDYEVAHAVIGKSALRTNLADGLKVSYEMNRLNKDFLEIDTMKLFEIGAVFPNTGEVINVAYMDNKGITEMNIDEYALEQNTTSSFSFGREAIAPFAVFQNWSDYPAITRDIAVWVPDDISSDTVISIIKQHTGDLLVRGPRLFDTFSKDGKTSYAFRMVFQSHERTLNELEINQIMEMVTMALREQHWQVR